MTSVDVSVDILKKMKTSLSAFQIDMQGIDVKAKQQAEANVRHCKIALSATKDEIEKTNAVIQATLTIIRTLETAIAADTKSLVETRGSIPALQSQLGVVGQQLSSLQLQRQCLSTQSLGSNGADADQQLCQIDGAITWLRAETDRIKEQIRASEEKMRRLEQQISQSKANKSQTELQLAVAKKRHANYQNKLERQTASYKKVESQFREYVAATKKMKNSASEMTAKNNAALDKCIDSIDEYLNTTIGVGNDAGINFSMNTSGELQQIADMDANGEFNLAANEYSCSVYVAHLALLTEKPMVIDLPANTSTFGIDEFSSQVAMQEDGLNSLTVMDFLSNYERRITEGRGSESIVAQRQYRTGLAESIADENMTALSGTTDYTTMNEDMMNEAINSLSGLAVLHNPDQIAGGSPSGITAAGSRNVNSALGSLWRQGRAEDLYEQIRTASLHMTEEQMRDTYLNVRLNVIER